MSIALSQWANTLEAATPVNQNTPAKAWICETWDAKNGNGRVYKALTPQEYQHFYATHSWWDRTFNCSCKKLSLNEITNVTYHFWANYKNSIDKEVRSISRQAMIDDVHAGDFEQAVKDKLLELKPDGSFNKIKENLQALGQRSAAKHTAEKTQGMWGKVKWAMWFYLNNTSEAINSLVGRMSAKGNFSALCEQACKSLQERILLNMDWFEEGVNHCATKEHPRTDFGSVNTLQRFATPKDVQKKWVTKFGPDRFPIPEKPYWGANKATLESYRVRIYALVNIWNHLVEFQKEYNEANAPAPGPAAGPLLLQ